MSGSSASKTTCRPLSRLVAALLLSLPLVSPAGLLAAPRAPGKAVAPTTKSQIDDIRTQARNGWWGEARKQIDALLATPEGAKDIDAYILKSEICIETLDIVCAYDILHQAPRPTPEAPSLLVKQKLEFLDAQFGQLVISGALGMPLRISQRAASESAYLQSAYDAAALAISQLETTGTNPPPIGSPRLHSWEILTEKPGGESGQLLKIYLPAGEYKLNNRSVAVAVGQTTSLILGAAPDDSPTYTYTAGYALTAPLGGSSLEPQGQVRFQLTVGTTKGGMRIGGGLTLLPTSADIRVDGMGLKQYTRVAVGVSVFKRMAIRQGIWLEPGAALEYMRIPFVGYDNCQGYLGAQTISGMCFVDGSAVSLTATTRANYRWKNEWYGYGDLALGVARVMPYVNGWYDAYEANTVFVEILDNPAIQPVLNVGLGVGRTF
jgi:hypothetical protein